MSHCAGCSNVLAHLGRQRGGDKRFQISVKSPVEMKPRLQSARHSESVSCNRNRVVCWLACTYFLQELAELSAFGISGAQVLLGCHHGADAASICVLSRAVHLPPLLRSDGLHSGAGVPIRRRSPQNYRQTYQTNSTMTTALSPHCCTGRLTLSSYLIRPSASSRLVFVFVFYTKTFYAAAVRLHGFVVGEVPQLNKKLCFSLVSSPRASTEHPAQAM